MGEKFITVCVLIGTADADATAEKRMFGTINAELEALREWLREQGCTHIAMEGPVEKKWIVECDHDNDG